MSALGIVLIVILVLLFLGSAPIYGGQPGGWHQYGWGPSGLVGLLLVVLLVLLLVHAI
jgi:hypothetical protein